MSATQDSTDTVSPHGLTARVLHWGFIAVFVYALTKQLDEVEELEHKRRKHDVMADESAVFEFFDEQDEYIKNIPGEKKLA